MKRCYLTSSTISTWPGRLNDGSKDRSRLAELNLKAGRQARAASAFEQALEYFTIGLELSGAAAWKRQYLLTLSLHDEATEMSWLCGRFELMEKLAGAVKDNAQKDLDLAKVYLLPDPGLHQPG